ncbi:MAG: hypothetical protein JXJ17_08355 [Anaerolineae bacterium]|nr:hypothetical protein [Anaerolineae bacterium]
MNRNTFALITLSILSAALLVSCSISGGEAPVEEAAAPVAEAPADAAQSAPVEGDAAAPAPADQPSEGMAFVGAGDAAVQLAIGTLYLQDTDTPITSEQAALLLPLWQQLKEAMSGEEYDQAAVDDLAAQIEAGMTGGQLAAIAALDQEALMTWMQESGVMPAFAGGERPEGERPEGAPPEGEMPEGERPEMPEGTPPAEGEMGPGGQPGGPGFGRGGTFMVDAVIECLSTLL